MFKKEYLYDFINEIYREKNNPNKAVSILIQRLNASNNMDMAKEIENIRDNNVTANRSSVKKINTKKYFEFYNSEIKKRTELVIQGYKNNLINSLLIYGKPGTGKTHYVTQLSKAFKIPLLKIKVEDIMDYRYGQSMKNLSNVFNKNKDTRQIIFFDEIDSLFTKRGSSNDLFESRRILTTMLQLLDLKSNVLIVFSTNLIDSIDKAIIRRFDIRIRFDSKINNSIEFVSSELAKHGKHLEEKEMESLKKWLSKYEFTLSDIKIISKRIIILKHMNWKWNKIIEELSNFTASEIQLSKTIEIKRSSE